MSGRFGRPSVVAAARRWIGTPYRHQASLIGVGCDCLGLVRGVWRELIGPEPEPLAAYAPDWALATRRESLAEGARRCLVEQSPTAVRPGDVLLFRWRASLPAAHVAILAEPDRMIHAHDGAAVAEVHLTRWWQRHLAFVFSFPGVCEPWRP
jgi:NlpC/P60 family putative phage cell wall peptidase